MDPLTLLALKRFAPWIIGAVALAALVGYSHHVVYNEGYHDAETMYKTRDIKATSEALGIIAKSKRINDNTFEKDKADYEKRIQKLTSKLALSSSAGSVSVRTKGSQACGEAKADNSKGGGGSVGESGVAELAEYNRGLLDQAETKITAMAEELLACSAKVRAVYDVR